MIVGAGGIPINIGGNILGGIGVSGAPSGITDEKCGHPKYRRFTGHGGALSDEHAGESNKMMHFLWMKLKAIRFHLFG